MTIFDLCVWKGRPFNKQQLGILKVYRNADYFQEYNQVNIIMEMHYKKTEKIRQGKQTKAKQMRFQRCKSEIKQK